MAEIKLRFTHHSNLPQHVRWFEFLSGNSFASQLQKAYSTPPHLRRLRAVAQQVVEEEIYSVSRGEGKIKESVEAASRGSGEMAVLFNPAISTSKGPFKNGGDPSKASYAAFFERLDFNSFIRALTPTAPIRYRPFWNPLQIAIHEESEKILMEAAMKTMRLYRPRQPKV